MTATERVPKVWIGCLAAYNEGTLHGQWFDVPDTEEELWAAIKTVIDSSPADHPEEWFFADNEDFHPWQPGEWPTIGKLVIAAELIREKGAAAAGWLANDETPLDSADDYHDLEDVTVVVDENYERHYFRTV